MLVTHLAIALTRSERRAPLAESPPAGLLAEIQGRSAERDFVRAWLTSAGDALGVALPEVEEVFVTAHLCTVTDTD